MNQKAWGIHYRRLCSQLSYPDDYLVAPLKRFFQANSKNQLYALDLGCGSGRHLYFLSEHSSLSVGQDFVFEVLQKQNTPKKNMVCARAEALPFQDHSFDLILAWGVLHYLSPRERSQAIREIHRILKPGAVFLGTLRSRKDTHLKNVLKEGDLKTARATLYSKKRALKCFASFSELRYGYMSRQPLGAKGTIAHHVIQAVK